MYYVELYGMGKRLFDTEKPKTKEISLFFFLAKLHLIFDKEVFVKHEQAPTAPKLEGVSVFVR